MGFNVQTQGIEFCFTPLILASDNFYSYFKFESDLSDKYILNTIPNEFLKFKLQLYNIMKKY